MKEYDYRVYQRDGTMLGTLSDVQNRHPNFSWDVFGGVGSLSLVISRSRADFCSCSDIILGNEIRVTEKNGGVQVYSGYINRASTGCDQEGKEYVHVEVLGYVSEFQKRIVEDSDGDTGLNALSADPSSMMSDILGLYLGKITAGTITASGITADCTWNSSTVLEAIGNIMDRLPNDWYWYVDGSNLLHLKEVATTPAHILTVGTQIGAVDVVVSLDSVVNDVRVLGGTPEGGEQLSSRYQDANSQASWGKSQKIVSDGRLYNAQSLQYIANSNLNVTPVGEASFDVFDNDGNSNGYDIESIKPGDVIVVKDYAQRGAAGVWDDTNWDEAYFDAHPNDVFGLPLIVKSISYFGDHIRVTAADALARGTKDLETVKRNFEEFQKKNAPVRVNV